MSSLSSLDSNAPQDLCIRPNSKASGFNLSPKKVDNKTRECDVNPIRRITRRVTYFYLAFKLFVIA